MFETNQSVSKEYKHVLFNRENFYLDSDRDSIVRSHNRNGRHFSIYSDQGFEMEIASDCTVWFSIHTAVHSGIRWVEVLNDDPKTPNFDEMTLEYQERMRTKWRMCDERKQGTVEHQGIMVAMAVDTSEMVSGAEIWPPL
jgi:hypothetical protein|tara:strand:+ start:682 stop:1101 length:420 start_codon:yes stop_codon:yes gene_type:complete